LAHRTAHGGLCFPPKQPQTRFRCVECTKFRYQCDVPANGICQYCRAKKRRPKNLPVNLTNELVVTTSVQKKITKVAKDQVPKERFLRISDTISKYAFIPFVLTSFPLAFLWFSKGELGGLIFPFILVWCLLPPYLISILLNLVTRKPRAIRRLLIDERLIQIAEKRRADIEERQTFYTSSEWLILRKNVIAKQGRVCATCRKYIRDEADITIDHIRPRSKHPHLSLIEENLQVLCRSCNSAKGATDLY